MKIILIVFIVIVLLVGSNAVQYVVHTNIREELELQHQAALGNLQHVIDGVGQMATAYTVQHPVIRGRIVRAEHLMPIEIPQTSVHPWTITEPEDFTETFWRIDVHPGTVITKDLLMNEFQDDSSVWVGVTLDLLPAGIWPGTYIDIRLLFPEGQSLIILSHKRVYDIIEDTVYLMLTEAEVQWLEGVYDDLSKFGHLGLTLYALILVDPGMQSPSTVFYSVPVHIANAILANPNIIDKGNMNANNEARVALEWLLATIPEDIIDYLTSGRNARIVQLRSAYETRRDELINAEGEVSSDNMYFDDPDNLETDSGGNVIWD